MDLCFSYSYTAFIPENTSPLKRKFFSKANYPSCQNGVLPPTQLHSLYSSFKLCWGRTVKVELHRMLYCSNVRPTGNLGHTEHTHQKTFLSLIFTNSLLPGSFKHNNIWSGQSTALYRWVFWVRHHGETKQDRDSLQKNRYSIHKEKPPGRLPGTGLSPQTVTWSIFWNL